MFVDTCFGPKSRGCLITAMKRTAIPVRLSAPSHRKRQVCLYHHYQIGSSRRVVPSEGRKGGGKRLRRGRSGIMDCYQQVNAAIPGQRRSSGLETATVRIPREFFGSSRSEMRGLDPEDKKREKRKKGGGEGI